MLHERGAQLAWDVNCLLVRIPGTLADARLSSDGGLMQHPKRCKVWLYDDLRRLTWAANDFFLVFFLVGVEPLFG